MRYFFDLDEFDVKRRADGEKSAEERLEVYNGLKIHESEDGKLIVRASKSDVLNENFLRRIYDVLIKTEDYKIDKNEITVVLDCNSNDYYYIDSEWQQIKEKATALSKIGVKFGFLDWNRIFNIKDVENANSKLSSSAEDIVSKGLSPFETLLDAYMTVTSRRYISEAKSEDGAISRSLYGVLNTNRLVCVGFSKWLKAIIQGTECENIKLYENRVNTTDVSNISEYHESLICYIKDEKYGIDGFYYLDPTFDSANDQKCPKFNYFLLPLDEIKNNARFKILSVNSCGEELRNVKIRSCDNQKDGELQINWRLDSSSFVSFGEDYFRVSEEFVRDIFTRTDRSSKMLARTLLEEAISNKYNKISKLTEENARVIQIIECFKDIEFLPNALLTEYYDAVMSANLDKCKELEKQIVGYRTIQEDIDKFINDFSAQVATSMFFDEASLKKQKRKKVEKLKNLAGDFSKNVAKFLKQNNSVAYDAMTNETKLANLKKELRVLFSFALMNGNSDITSNLEKTYSKKTINSISVLFGNVLEENNSEIDELNSGIELIKMMVQSPKGRGDVASLINIEESTALRDYLLQSSKKIKLGAFKSAMSTVLKSTQKYKPASIRPYIEDVLVYNKKRAGLCFKKSSDNTFTETIGSNRANERV